MNTVEGFVDPDAQRVIDADEQVSINFEQTVKQEAKRMFNPAIQALRAQLPFLPIMPFPNVVQSFKLTADMAVDVNLPEGTQLIGFSGNGEYYVSRQGKAAVPTGTQDISGTGTLMNPELVFWYVAEVRQLSIVAPITGTIVTVQIFQQL